MRSWLPRGDAPSWQKPRRGSALDPYVPLLERRWAEGCHNATRLWREATAAGYAAAAPAPFGSGPRDVAANRPCRKYPNPCRPRHPPAGVSGAC